MSDLDMPALIQQLQKSNRRWKRLAISLLAVIGLALPLLATSVVVLKVRAEREARAALDAAEQARQQAQEAAEKARQQELQKRFDEQRKAVDEFQNKGRNP
jgi:flagellar biosynthesis/type III secretory pathway M-ring protein FliF/YscJ